MGLALSTSFFFFFSSTSPFWWFFTSAAESERERERVHSLASIFPFASMHRAALVVDRSTQESQNGV
jgi:hypothetical protein